jgi:hypothetical protein
VNVAAQPNAQAVEVTVTIPPFVPD